MMVWLPGKKQWQNKNKMQQKGCGWKIPLEVVEQPETHLDSVQNRTNRILEKISNFFFPGETANSQRLD